jgi:hypothetical protein
MIKKNIPREIGLSFLLASAALLLILYFRVTRGIDFTDEMQYYGEISGLIETGRLFSNDLFIQQSVYILFYPFFWIHNAAFGSSGLIFFGRILMACITIAVYVHSYRKLIAVNFSTFVSAITALSLTFAIPFHGIFALSYNTVSQALWIVFVLTFFEWKQRTPISLSVIPIITAFAHPTSALIMVLLILLRLSVEKDFQKVGKVLLALLVGALVAMPIIFYFAMPLAYLNSIVFSSGYGVGTAFFSSEIGPVVLLSICIMFGIVALFQRQDVIPNISAATILVIFVACIAFMNGFVGDAYTHRTVYVLAIISVVAYVGCHSGLANSNHAKKSVDWMAFAILAYAATLGITSGNGIGQATGAFMVGVPLFLAISVSSKIKDESSDTAFLEATSVLLVLVLFVIHWGRYPYREAAWWLANQPISSSPAFKFIATTPDRNNFLQQMKQVMDPIAASKRTLIVGEFPVLYFLSNIQPETCMLYMHSLASDDSENSLLKCLNSKNPETVLNLTSNISMASEQSRIKKVLKSFYGSRGFYCTNHGIVFNREYIFNPEWIKYEQCVH